MIDRVRTVGVDENQDVFVVGISAEADGHGEALIFQIPIDEDLVDETETYCTLDHEHRMADGGVRSVSIRDQTLVIELTHEAAADLEVSPSLSLPLEIPEAAVESLRVGLMRIFRYGVLEQQPELAL